MSTNLRRFLRGFLSAGALFLAMFSHAQMNGIYTIDKNAAPSATNFISFTSAASSLKSGVSGPVTINVAALSGPYNEQVTIDTIPGTSTVNTVAINGNGNTLSFAPVTANRYVLRIRGAKHVTLDSLRIVGTDATYGYGILLSNSADSNTINNCTIDLSAITSTTATNSAGITSSNSTSSNATAGNNASHCMISNNKVIGGTAGGPHYGIRLNGSSTTATLGNGNKIINNTVSDFQSYGIYLSYSLNTLVSGNDISRPTHGPVGTFYGVYVTNNAELNIIEKNRIHNTHGGASSLTGSAYAIYFSSNDAATGNENRVINNLIYDFNGDGGLVYALYNSSSNGVYYWYNTISLDRSSASAGTTRGFYQITTASNIELKNNIISITRGGVGAKHGIYLGTSGTTLISNNNNIYLNSAGTGEQHVGYWSSTNYTTLMDWQTANSNAYDANSLSLNPLYTDLNNHNYIPVNAALNGTASPLPSVTTDFSGATRDAVNPDPGAFEFSPPNDDAGISSILQPHAVCAGTADSAFAVLTNYGLAQLNTVNINWSVNGVLQAPLALNPALASGASVPVKLGDVTVMNGGIYNIKAWTSLPNGIADPSTLNDTTVHIGLEQAMAGTYTIGAAGDFPNLMAAIAVLNKNGICGPVTFNVDSASGPYNGQLEITTTYGSNSGSTITFNGNGAIITAAPNSIDRHVVRLNNATYVTLDNFTIRSTDVDYGFGVLLMNVADYNTISHCMIDMSAVTNTGSTNSAGITSSASPSSNAVEGNNANHCIFSNNTIMGGSAGGAYYGIRLNGAAGGFEATGNQITNNIIRDHYTYQVYLNDCNSTLVNGNDISRANRQAVGSFYGVFFTGICENNVISQNRIHNTHDAATSQTGSAYGIYFSSADATPGNENMVYNNLLYKFNGGGDIYGAYNTGSDGVHYYFNTFSLGNESAAAGIVRGLYQTTLASGIVFQNNIVAIKHGGNEDKHGLYFNTTTSGITSNNNDIYVTSTGSGVAYTGYYGSTNFSTLQDWKTANSGLYDQNSVGTDPLFQDVAADNYVPRNAFLDNKAANIGSITTDINGTARGVNPDMGAIEFAAPNSDAGIFAIVYPVAPCPGTDSVMVELANFGGNALNNVTINWTLNGTPQTVVNYATPLAAAQSVIVKLGNITVTTGASLSVKAWTSSPNGVADIINENDTVFVNNLPASLNGTYTVGATGDYTTLTAAVADLNFRGVCGPVVFNVDAASGPYTGRIAIGPVKGSNMVNTVIFNGNTATITDTTPTSDRYVVLLDGATYVTLDNFGIVTTGPTYGYGILLTHAANYNTITNCTIDISSVNSTTSTNSTGIAATNSLTDPTTAGNNANYCVISNNIVRGGSTTSGLYYAIRLNGSTGGIGCEGNQVIDNIIEDCYIYNIYLSECRNTIVRGNDISRPYKQTVSTFYGIYLTGTCENTLIEKNRIHNTQNGASSLTGAVYPFYFSSCDASVGNENLVVNNLVYNINNEGTTYAFYNSGSDGAHYFHNTVSLDHTAATAGITRGFYQTTAATNIEIKNNLISITKGGSGVKHGLYFNTNTSVIATDNNNIYLASAGSGAQNFGRWDGTDHVDLISWKTANSGAFDQNSVSMDPSYLNLPGNNLAPTNLSFNNGGTPIAAVTTDFRDRSRNATTPDIGAFEFGEIPLNDGCNNAIVITNDTIYGTTYDATPDPTPACGAANTAGGVWYQYLSTGEYVTASLCGTAYNTRISVFQGSCAALQCVVNNDDFCGSQSSVDFCAEDGVTYYILVHGSTIDDQGNFELILKKVPTAPATIIAGGNTTFCEGDSLVLTANTAEGYVWSTGSNDTLQSLVVKTTGNYTVMTTDTNSCTDVSEEMIVTVNNLPVVYLGEDTTICDNESITLDGGTFASYSWSTGATSQTIVIDGSAGAGTFAYTLTATDGNGCINTDEISVTIDICGGIEEAGEDLSLLIYPNPSNGEVTVSVSKVSNEQLFIEVTDIQGRLVHAERMEGQQARLDLSSESKGWYLIKVYSATSISFSKLIIK